MDELFYYICLGVILLTAIVLAGVFLLRKKLGRKMDAQYDERQMLARGQAYRAGFFTMAVYFVLFGVVSELGFVWCEIFIGCFIGFVLGVLVFALTAICKDAYLALNQNMKQFYLVGGLFCVSGLLRVVTAILSDSLIVDGKLTREAVFPVMGVVWLVLLIAQLIHNRRLKTQALSEDEV